MFDSGVLCPTVTPVDSGLAIDHGRLADQARWLLASGCHGVVLFGTTGEAVSFATAERQRALEALLEAGLPPRRLMVGVGGCALAESLALARHAADAGCTDLLVLPPFYYKPVSDDGLLTWFERLAEGLGGRRARLYLYHIPPLAGVGFSTELVGRLAERIPAVTGLKDSGGDAAHTLGLVRDHPGLAIFAGSEGALRDVLEAGGAGCISATANVNAAPLRALFDAPQGEPGAARQAAVSDFRNRLARWPMIPALKALLAAGRDDAAWARLHPPLLPLAENETATLRAALTASGNGLPELTLESAQAS